MRLRRPRTAQSDGDDAGNLGQALCELPHDISLARRQSEGDWSPTGGRCRAWSRSDPGGPRRAVLQSGCETDVRSAGTAARRSVVNVWVGGPVRRRRVEGDRRSGSRNTLHPAAGAIPTRTSSSLTDGVVADAAFVDGSHLFHNVFVDLYFLRRTRSAGRTHRARRLRLAVGRHRGAVLRTQRRMANRRTRATTATSRLLGCLNHTARRVSRTSSRLAGSRAAWTFGQSQAASSPAGAEPAGCLRQRGGGGRFGRLRSRGRRSWRGVRV